MRSILISFVPLFWAWQPVSAEDAKQLTTPNRENLGVRISQINDEAARSSAFSGLAAQLSITSSTRAQQAALASCPVM